LIYPPASDIAVQDGKILCIGSLSGIFSAKRTIDAEGGYVTPGGVDTHVHLDQISLVGAVGDKFETGTRSAIAGGTTTLVCFALQQKTDESVLPVVESYHKKVLALYNRVLPSLSQRLGRGSLLLRLLLPPNPHQPNTSHPHQRASHPRKSRHHIRKTLHDLRRHEAPRSANSLRDDCYQGSWNDNNDARRE
jgi:hypothetical protein